MKAHDMDELASPIADGLAADTDLADVATRVTR